MSDKPNPYLKLLKAPLFVAAATFFAILIAAVLQWTRSKVPFEYLMIGLAFIFLVTIFGMVVVSVFGRAKNQQEFDDKISDLSNLMINNNLTWIVNQNYVQMVEAKAEEKWVFAPELTYAIQKGTAIYQGIEDNLAAGSKFKYFMPDRPRVNKMIADFERLHKYQKDQVEFILIPTNQFFFHTIISVYNPRTDEPVAIEWLPVQDLNIWVQMDPKHANRMVGIGEILLKQLSKEKATDTKKRGLKKTNVYNSSL